MVSRFFAPTLLTLVSIAALVACGGGATAAAPNADAAATAASLATARNMGATVITGASSDEETYNLAADVGDSWQPVLDHKASTYVVKLLASPFNLNTTTAASFTKITRRHGHHH